MSWETVVGTAVMSSVLTLATSTFTARRSAADARRHWAQAAKLRESSERLLHAADAFSQLALAEIMSYWGTASKTIDPEAVDGAFDDLLDALRALRLDADDELLSVLDEIAWRARRMRHFARGTFGAIVFPDDFRRPGSGAQCEGVHPAFEQAVRAFEAGARVGLGHTVSKRSFRRARRVRSRY